MIRLAASAVLLLLAVGCVTKSTQNNPSNSAQKEISRERAIEIARAQVKFQPKSTEAVKTTENGRAVWRVTFRGEPISKDRPFSELIIVVLDRASAEIVSIAQS